MYKYISNSFTSKDRKDVIVIIIIHIKILEAHIPSWITVIEARVHVALHLMKKIQIVHQFMKHIASTALDENGSIGVSMRIDGTSGPLTANIASEGNAHPSTWRFGEEGPREG